MITSKNLRVNKFNVSGRFDSPQSASGASMSPDLKGRPSYDGAELRPYEGRIGAMDAFNLPSLVNGIPTPRKSPILNSDTKK